MEYILEKENTKRHANTLRDREASMKERNKNNKDFFSVFAVI